MNTTRKIGLTLRFDEAGLPRVDKCVGIHNKTQTSGLPIRRLSSRSADSLPAACLLLNASPPLLSGAAGDCHVILRDFHAALHTTCCVNKHFEPPRQQVMPGDSDPDTRFKLV